MAVDGRLSISDPAGFSLECRSGSAIAERDSDSSGFNRSVKLLLQ